MIDLCKTPLGFVWLVGCNPGCVARPWALLFNAVSVVLFNASPYWALLFSGSPYCKVQIIVLCSESCFDSGPNFQELGRVGRSIDQFEDSAEFDFLKNKSVASRQKGIKGKG